MIMEEHQIQARAIDYRKVWKSLKERKSLFLKTLPVAFVIGCIYTLSIPRFYITSIKLAPEMENSNTGGALSSIASSFGFDLSEMQTTDAITPLLYPELMEDNGFVSDLFNIRVTSKDSTINTTYKEYLQKHQKHEWWNVAIGMLTDLFKSKSQGGSSEFDRSHKPAPGCQIVVPTKKQRQSFGIQQWMSLGTTAASLGTMAASIANILK